MNRLKLPKTDQWSSLSRNDWGEILELSRAKTFQRKFQIVEAFTKLVAEKGYHQTKHGDIAKACKVTRQLVDHHFPTDRALLVLTYRYIYARFQKHASDALVSRQGALNQFKAYVTSIPAWVQIHPADATFLIHYFGIAPVYPELSAFLERNIKIGQERIHTLLIGLRDKKQIAAVSDEVLLEQASSVQFQIFGFVVLNSGPRPMTAAAAQKKGDELWRSCAAVVGAAQTAR